MWQRRAPGTSGAVAGQHLTYHIVDHEIIALLEEAADALAGSDSPTLVGVLSQLGFALQHNEPDRMVDVTDHAVRIARQRGDHATLAAAMSARMHARWGTREPRDALAEADELSTLAQRTGDAELITTALTWRFHYSLVLTDVAAARVAAAELQDLAERSRQPFLQLVAATRAATLAAVTGRFAEAIEQAEHAWRIGTQAQLPDADGVHWAQLFGIWLFGGLDAEREQRMERLLRTMVDSTAMPFWHQSALALIESTTHDREQAALRFESLAAELESVRHDGLYDATMAVLAECCVRLGSTGHAPELSAALEPAADHLITGSGVFCLGSGHLYLGRLAALTERRDDAERHYRAAIEQHRRAGAEAMLACSNDGLAGIRRRQGAPADADKVERAVGEEAALIEQPQNANASTPTVQQGEFRRSGRIWQIEWEDTSVTVPDSKGMRDLAALLAAPGREVAAPDLVEAAGGPPVAGTGGHLGDRLDTRAREAYRQRLADLEDELAEAEDNADAGRVEALRSEKKFLAAELAGALGMGGRARTEGDPVERARKAVGMRIRTALKAIAEVAPGLARHLDRSVSTGRLCVYQPEHPVHWRL